MGIIINNRFVMNNVDTNSGNKVLTNLVSGSEVSFVENNGLNNASSVAGSFAGKVN